jgi:hypothetical protein
MHSGSHKTDAGFREILAIHAGINRGPSTAVKTHFPDLKPALLPSYSLTLSSPPKVVSRGIIWMMNCRLLYYIL